MEASPTDSGIREFEFNVQSTRRFRRRIENDICPFTGRVFELGPIDRPTVFEVGCDPIPCTRAGIGKPRCKLNLIRIPPSGSLPIFPQNSPLRRISGQPGDPFSLLDRYLNKLMLPHSGTLPIISFDMLYKCITSISTAYIYQMICIFSTARFPENSR
jgi:hypothetical protein